MSAAPGGVPVNHGLIEWWCNEVVGDASGCVVAANRGVRRGDGKLDRNLIDFEWRRSAGLLAVSVTYCASLVAEQAQAWTHARSSGFDSGVMTGVPSTGWTEAETMLRLQTFTDQPADPLVGGRGDQVLQVLGLHLDLDVAQRRHDGKLYCPTIGMAVEFWSAWSPTYIIDAGGGVVAVWLFDQPHTDIEAARLLGLDLLEAVEVACDDRGWDFDSPSPLTAWLKVPGTWSAIYDRLVVPIDGGERWAFAELRAVTPEAERHQYHGYRPGMTTFLGKPIPRPGQRRDGFHAKPDPFQTKPDPFTRKT